MHGFYVFNICRTYVHKDVDIRVVGYYNANIKITFQKTWETKTQVFPYTLLSLRRCDEVDCEKLREMIIEMLGEINSEKFLIKIWTILKKHVEKGGG